MMMRTLTVVAVLFAAQAAQAADMREVRKACGPLPVSPLLHLSSPQMRDEVGMRFERSVQIANAQQTIASTSPRFVWATEAKAACGIAIGFFGGGEINEEWVSKCDCFYGRMMAYTNAVR